MTATAAHLAGYTGPWFGDRCAGQCRPKDATSIHSATLAVAWPIMHTLSRASMGIVVRSSGGSASVKRSSNKARRQRDDRAFAEFDAMMRRLAQTTQREPRDARVDSGLRRAGEREHTDANATQE